MTYIALETIGLLFKATRGTQKEKDVQNQVLVITALEFKFLDL